jgi:hypothetical protein
LGFEWLSNVRAFASVEKLRSFQAFTFGGQVFDVPVEVSQQLCGIPSQVFEMGVFGETFFIADANVVNEFAQRTAALAAEVSSVFKGVATMTFGYAIGHRAGGIAHLGAKLEFGLGKEFGKFEDSPTKRFCRLVDIELFKLELNGFHPAHRHVHRSDLNY